jgi:uncharacterized membrane protein
MAWFDPGLPVSSVPTTDTAQAADLGHPRAWPAARLDSVDAVRGVIMVLMALDHVRDFFGTAGNPTDLTTTTAGLFFTRWITHVCAPGFFLLTGVGSRLALRTRSRAELSRFLVTRGAWLILLEIVFVRSFALQFNVDYRVTVLTVLWALGWAMITLALLIRWDQRTILAIGLTMIALHNLLDGVSLGALWNVVHGPGMLLTGSHLVLVGYPLVPWIGVTAVGFCLGQVYDWPAERRRPWLLRTGMALSLGFLVLRALNVYGDPVPWSTQSSPLFTLLSVLNTSKYPPSLLFLLMTLGPVLCLLGLLDRGTPVVLAPAELIGRVPLFYYLVHFPLIHLLAVGFCYVRYGEAHWMFESPSLDHFPFTRPPGWGYGLAVCYGIWVGLVLVMYPLCRWYAGLKRRRRDWWLGYL